MQQTASINRENLAQMIRKQLLDLSSYQRDLDVEHRR